MLRDAKRCLRDSAPRTPATRTIAREFRTSPMMLLLMNSDGGPSDPKTRTGPRGRVLEKIQFHFVWEKDKMF